MREVNGVQWKFYLEIEEIELAKYKKVHGNVFFNARRFMKRDVDG